MYYRPLFVRSLIKCLRTYFLSCRSNVHANTEYRNCSSCSSCGMYKKYIKSYNGVVSFDIFIKLILDETGKKCEQIHKCKSDFHWRPFISQCAYCHAPYTIIGKLETADEDQKYISLMANVTFPKIGNMANEFKV